MPHLCSRVKPGRVEGGMGGSHHRMRSLPSPFSAPESSPPSPTTPPHTCCHLTPRPPLPPPLLPAAPESSEVFRKQVEVAKLELRERGLLTWQQLPVDLDGLPYYLGQGKKPFKKGF